MIIKLATRLIPDSSIEDDDVKIVKFIDDRMIETPSIALLNVEKETLRMGEKSKQSLDCCNERYNGKIGKRFI